MAQQFAQPTEMQGQTTQQSGFGSQPQQIGQQPSRQHGSGEFRGSAMQQQQMQAGQGPQQFSQFGQQGQDVDIKLDEALSDEMRVVLHDAVQAVTVCEWCAERCIDHGPEMAECLRLCRDVADLASLNVQLISRDSVFGPEVAEVFATAAEECAQECARHPQSHCQECAEVLPRAARSTRKMLASFGGTQGSQWQGQSGSGTGMGGAPQQAQIGQQF